MPRGKRFSIYDAMEEKGVFESNTANVGARNADGMPTYKKEDYPKMLYHPQGLTRVVQPAELVMTPVGAVERNEQRELINIEVRSEREEKALLAQGWHQHPALAIAAAGLPKPPMSPTDALTRSLDAQAAQERRIKALKEALKDSGMSDEEIEELASGPA